MNKTTNQIIKNVNDVTIGQVIGMSFTNNNRTYKIAGPVVKINGNTIHIENKISLREGDLDRVFPYSFRKSTKSNHVFESPNFEEINTFNKKEQDDYNEVTAILNKAWETKIAKIEQEQKKQGVYEESTVYEIDFGKGELVPQYKTYGVSV